MGGGGGTGEVLETKDVGFTLQLNYIPKYSTDV